MGSLVALEASLRAENLAAFCTGEDQDLDVAGVYVADEVKFRGKHR